VSGTALVPVLKFDYTACPGGCVLKEFQVGGWPSGKRHGCLGQKCVQGEGGSRWLPEYAAWVCWPAWVEYVKMREAKELPPMDQEMVTHSRQLRASMRPRWLKGVA
jgi:hypothetical protein